MTASLAELFAAHTRTAVAHADEASALEAKLADLVAAARASWPDVAVENTELLRHIAERLPEGSALAALERVHASDLYLACGCLRGDPRALAAFQQRYWAEVSAYIASVDRSDAFADEVRQLLWQRLFVAAPGSRPRIGDYSGAGPLGAWLRVAAIRTARSLRRADKPVVEREPHAAAVDPEIAYLKTRYSAEVNEALRRTLGALPPREKNILSLYFVDGMSSAAIGELYSVHGATVRRWIERAREHLVRETRRLLAERLKLRPRDLDSLLDLVRSRLDVSVTTLMRERRR